MRTFEFYQLSVRKYRRVNASRDEPSRLMTAPVVNENSSGLSYQSAWEQNLGLFPVKFVTELSVLTRFGTPLRVRDSNKYFSRNFLPLEVSKSKCIAGSTFAVDDCACCQRKFVGKRIGLECILGKVRSWIKRFNAIRSV